MLPGIHQQTVTLACLSSLLYQGRYIVGRSVLYCGQAEGEGGW